MSSKDLVIQKLSNSPLVKKEYKQMLTNINATLPAIKNQAQTFTNHTHNLWVSCWMLQQLHLLDQSSIH